MSSSKDLRHSDREVAMDYVSSTTPRTLEVGSIDLNLGKQITKRERETKRHLVTLGFAKERKGSITSGEDRGSDQVD